MTDRQELTCPKTGKQIDRKWIGKWSDSLYLAFCDCGKVHELVRTAHGEGLKGGPNER